MIYMKDGKLLVKDGKLCSTCCALECPAEEDIGFVLSATWCEACFGTGGWTDLVIPIAGHGNFSLVEETSIFCRYYWQDNQAVYRSNFYFYKGGINRGKVFFDFYAHSGSPITKWIFYKCSENPTAQNPAPNLYD
ncbi:unnamed protein product, partial [marine sediment metagenome]